MSNVFTLDSLREEADKKFSAFKIPLSDGTEVVLRNFLRLNKATRDAVQQGITALNAEADKAEGDLDAFDKKAAAAIKIIEAVADANGKKLTKEIDGDIALLIQVINAWMGATQLGEADSSPA